MQGIGWIAALIMGGFAGWIASKVMKAETGIFVNIILGIVGAMLANWLLGVVGLEARQTWFAQGAVGFGGACLLIGLGRAVRR